MPHAESIETVHAFHNAGVAVGGIDNGQPGYRSYHESYYAAFLLDPDGNNVEAVRDVGVARSSASVLPTRKGAARSMRLMLTKEPVTSMVFVNA